MGVLGFDDGLDQLQALPLGGERGGACGAVRGLERGCDPGSGAPLDEVPDGVAGRWTLAEIGVEVGSARRMSVAMKKYPLGASVRIVRWACGWPAWISRSRAVGRARPVGGRGPQMVSHHGGAVSGSGWSAASGQSMIHLMQYAVVELT